MSESKTLSRNNFMNTLTAYGSAANALGGCPGSVDLKQHEEYLWGKLTANDAALRAEVAEWKENYERSQERHAEVSGLFDEWSKAVDVALLAGRRLTTSEECRQNLHHSNVRLTSERDAAIEAGKAETARLKWIIENEIAIHESPHGFWCQGVVDHDEYQQAGYFPDATTAIDAAMQAVNKPEL